MLIDGADFEAHLRGLHDAIEEGLRCAFAQVRILLDLTGEYEETLGGEILRQQRLDFVGAGVD